MNGSNAHRGKLRIYLGAAPGVGKTVAMLREGRRLRADGVDTVVGFVETHGRAETAARIRDLEVIPRKSLYYSGVALEEMDTSAIISRRPHLVLVDELAHSNVPGSTHAKRWQDVESLLDAGIDVISTLNVQHIEELADVVVGITGAPVHETVPSKVIDEADEILLVDLPADVLIERLGQGKIYPEKQAKLALDHYFREANLTALRELALRRTAEDVNDHLSELMLGSADSPLDTANTVAVLIDDNPEWGEVVRKAWRLASAFHTELIAIDARSSELESNRTFARNSQLAMDLGADLVQASPPDTSARRTAEAIAGIIQSRHIAVLVMAIRDGKSGRVPWNSIRWREAKLIAEIDQQAPLVDIHLVKLGN